MTISEIVSIVILGFLEEAKNAEELWKIATIERNIITRDQIRFLFKSIRRRLETVNAKGGHSKY